MGKVVYEGTLYPDLAPKNRLLKHRVLSWRGGTCFQPHLVAVRNYVFSDLLHPGFQSPMRISARLGIGFMLVSLLHWRLGEVRMKEFTPRKLELQQRVFIGSEAVYLYEDEYNPAIERELMRSWKAVLTSTTSWQQDGLESRYLSTLQREIYQGDSIPSLLPIAQQTLSYLQSLPQTDIQNNLIHWHSPIKS